jgi:hypothetical protein
MSGSNTFVLVGGIDLCAGKPGFLIPIFSKPDSKSCWIQECHNHRLVQMRELEGNPSIIPCADSTEVLRTRNAKQVHIYRAADLSLHVGDVASLKGVLLRDSQHSKSTDLGVQIQIALLTGNSVKLVETRQAFQHSQIEIGMTRSLWSYQNSVAREVGWNAIEGRIRHDAEMVEHFRKQRADYDFFYNECGEISFRQYSTNTTINSSITAAALEETQERLHSLSLGLAETPVEPQQLNLPIEDYQTNSPAFYRTSSRQEIRLAQVIGEALESPNRAPDILREYRDRAKFADRMVTMLEEEIRQPRLLEDSGVEAIVASFVDKMYNQAFYANRGFLLAALAKQLGQYPLIHAAIERRINASVSWQTNQYRDEVLAQLKRHQ